MLNREYLERKDPDLLKALDTFGDSLASRFNCHRVGVITKFYPEKLTVDVSLRDKIIFRNTVQDFTTIMDLPLLIQGSNNSHLTFGNIEGCEVLVHFNDTDIDFWFQTGEAYEPNTPRKHDFSDGFAELRPHSQPNVFEYDLTGTVLSKGSCKVKMTDTTVEITNGTSTIFMEGNNITITGNVTVNGTVGATGQVSSDVDVLSAGISGKGHTHNYNPGPGSPTPTEPPQ